MTITVDARGCQCPEPVIKTKKAMALEHDEITVMVDNRTSLENIKRFAKNHGHEHEVTENDGYYSIRLTRI